MRRFEGRTIIVTGGASGIGFETVGRLLGEGAHVAVWDLDLAGLSDLPDEASDHVMGIELNLTDPEAVYAARDKVLAARGRIDGLLCSAGITGPNATVADYPEDAWRKVIDVNV
ncbi:MAG: SDR family NAD(P)-dependent oxidoreductase, partial [Rhizobiales bacterium]|nr:SDR family NAD(P)-dependent oxidoreductase [Hyphomicrobiales bacterium]